MYGKRLLPLLVTIMTVVALGACSRQPVRPNPEPQLREIQKTGYVPQAHYQTTSVHEVWEHDGASIDASYVAPSGAKAERFPLIVFLPGLGEQSTA